MPGVPVHDLAGVRVHEDELAHVRAVRDLDLVDELVRARHVPDESHPVDLERRRGRPEAGRGRRRHGVGVLLRARRVRRDLRDGLLRGLRCGQPRRHVELHVRRERAVHRRQPVAAVEVRADHPAEDRQPLIALIEGDVREAVRSP